MRNRLLGAMGMVYLLGLVSAAGGAEAVTVKAQAPTVETRRFDPSDPPREMPPLSPEEAAVANSAFGVQSSVEAVVVKDETQGRQTVSTMKVEAIRAELSLGVTIWLPENAPRELIEHEEGHRRISELFYEDSERVMRSLARLYIGQTVRGQGRTAEAARQDAMNKVISELNGRYMAAIQMPSARVNDIYDKITMHGQSSRVSVDQAIQQALKAYREEQQGGRSRAAMSQPSRQPAP